MTDAVLAAALEYAARGWRCFPVNARKEPLTEHGFHDASTDPAQLAQLFGELNGSLGVGITTGALSGLVVLDVDDQYGGAGSLNHLEGKHGSLPRTHTVLTGGGGRHFYFAYPAFPAEVRNSAGKLGSGLDIRAEGGYVVAPPSPHETGRPYKLIHDRELAELPEWLLAKLTADSSNASEPDAPREQAADTTYGRAALASACERIRAAVRGQRDEVLHHECKGIGRLVGGGELLEETARRELGAAIEDLLAAHPDGNAKKARHHLTRQHNGFAPSFERGMARPKRAPEAPVTTKAREAAEERQAEEAAAEKAAAEVASEVTQPSESPESPTDLQGEETGNGLTDSALTESVRLESPPLRDERGRGADSDCESPRPFALPVSEFIALDRPQAEPLLADTDGRAVVARKSLVLLGASGGHGKTTFALDLLLHLAAGVDYPPFTVPEAISVLLIENEGPEEMFAQKLKDRLASFPHELKGRLDVCTIDWGGFSLRNEPLRERLTHEIAEKGYSLVFGDPLDSLGIAGVGSPENTREFLALMKATGLNKSVAWWLNTHPRKEETREALDEISGAWGGKPDSVLLLRMLADNRTQIRFPKLRWTKRGTRPTILLAFDPDTQAFTYLGEESEEERDYWAEIKLLLKDGRWRTPREVAAPKPGGIGANVDTIKAVLLEHPDVFESRTGAAAKELGRSSTATVWQLKAEEGS